MEYILAGLKGCSLFCVASLFIVQWGLRSSDLMNFFLRGERSGSSFRGALDMVMLKRDMLGLRGPGVLGVLGAESIFETGNCVS